MGFLATRTRETACVAIRQAPWQGRCFSSGDAGDDSPADEQPVETEREKWDREEAEEMELLLAKKGKYAQGQLPDDYDHDWTRIRPFPKLSAVVFDEFLKDKWLTDADKQFKAQMERPLVEPAWPEGVPAPSEEVMARVAELGQRRRVLELTMSGFDNRMFEASERIIMAARMLPNTIVRGPTPVKKKVKKFTIIKGPFKHKRHRHQFEIERKRRKIEVDTTHELGDKFMEFLKENTPGLIAIKVKMHDYVPVADLYSFGDHVDSSSDL